MPLDNGIALENLESSEGANVRRAAFADAARQQGPLVWRRLARPTPCFAPPGAPYPLFRAPRASFQLSATPSVLVQRWRLHRARAEPLGTVGPHPRAQRFQIRPEPPTVSLVHHASGSFSTRTKDRICSSAGASHQAKGRLAERGPGRPLRAVWEGRPGWLRGLLRVSRSGPDR
jgi:hypothetical protein